MRKLIGLCLCALAAVGCGSVSDAPVPVQASSGDSLVTTSTAVPAPQPEPDLTPYYEYAAALQRAETATFLNAWWAADLDRYFGLIRQAEADQAAAAQRARESSRGSTAPGPYKAPKVVAPTGGGGGCAIPAYICQRESGGSYTAVNPSSGAGGKYQFLPSTWRALGGTGLPQHAPPHIQDAMAAKLWAGGAGCAHWSAC